MLPLAICLLVQSIPQQPVIARMRAMVDSATHAIERDSVIPLERAWQARAGRDGVALLGVATLARLRYDYPTADARYRLLLRNAAPGPNPLHFYARLGLGLSLAARFEVTAGMEALGAALEEAVALGDAAGEVEARLTLAQLTARRAGFDSARKVLLGAAALSARSDSALRARTLCALGGLLRGSDIRRADSLSSEGLRLARGAAALRALGACLAARAQVVESRGRQDSARLNFYAAADVLQEAHDRYALASVHQWLAFQGVQFAMNFWRGRDHALAAIAGGRRSGNAAAEAWARLNLAQLAARVGDLPAARAQTDTASALFARLGDRLGLANLAYARAQVELAAQRPREARRFFLEADSLNAALGFLNARPGIALQIAATYRLEGQLEASGRSLAAAEEGAQRAGLAGIQNDVRYERGLLALARGDWDSAEARFREFLTGTRPEAWGIRLDAEVRLAEALARGHRLDEAETALGQALLALTPRRFRAEYQNREGQVAFLTARRFDGDSDLGLATIVSLLAREGRHQSAFRIAEAMRGQFLFARTLASRGSSNQESSTLAELFLPDSADLAGLAAQVPDSTALLFFVTGMGGEPTTLFALTQASLASYQLAAIDSLRESIGRFAAALEGGSAAKTLGARLGRQLLAPALRRLDPSISRLVIVPDGPLFRLPFDALLLPDGHFVLERYDVALAPSARLAARRWATAVPATSTRSFLFGNPALDPALGLPRLPGSGEEARTISGIVASPTLRLGAEASEHAVKSEPLANAGVLHFATHADAPDQGILDSGIKLTAGEGQDGHLGVAEIAELKLNDALVVLTGCRTLGGVVVNGEGLQGLATPFFEAGARTIVATHWVVGDRSIPALIAAFYRSMAAGNSVGAALRAAKLQALGRGASPAVWASLVLIGDGGLKPRVF